MNILEKTMISYRIFQSAKLYFCSMNKLYTDIAKLVNEHIQSLDPYAEVLILFPQMEDRNVEPTIYVLTPARVDYSLEKLYLNARYQVEHKSRQSLSLFIYNKEDWHKQFKDTPIYHQVHTEGVLV
jgi:hypothetical protein